MREVGLRVEVVGGKAEEASLYIRLRKFNLRRSRPFPRSESQL